MFRGYLVITHHNEYMGIFGDLAFFQFSLYPQKSPCFPAPVFTINILFLPKKNSRPKQKRLTPNSTMYSCVKMGF